MRFQDGVVSSQPLRQIIIHKHTYKMIVGIKAIEIEVTSILGLPVPIPPCLSHQPPLTKAS